jgi:predicted RNA binding protein YcfA (HicA-like mRNA interferase family)
VARLYRDLIRMLKESGCVFMRQGRGDHEIWFSPVSSQNFTVDAGIDKRHLANEVLKQAGLPKHF